MFQADHAIVPMLERARDLAGEGHVVEIGSMIMHDHDPRPMFEGRGYFGVDHRDGPGVDVVALSTDVLPDELSGAALALSINALEHDPFWRATIEQLVHLASARGVVAITVPEDPWPEHDVECAPGGGSYYGNRSIGEVVEAVASSALVEGRSIRSAFCWRTFQTSGTSRPRANVVVAFGDSQSE